MMTTKPFGLDRLRAMPPDEVWADECGLSAEAEQRLEQKLEELKDTVMKAVSPHSGDLAKEVLDGYLTVSSAAIEWRPRGPMMRICLGESFEFGLNIPIIDCLKDEDWHILDKTARFTEAEVIETCEVILTSLRPLHEYIGDLIAELEHRKKNPGTETP